MPSQSMPSSELHSKFKTEQKYAIIVTNTTKFKTSCTLCEVETKGHMCWIFPKRVFFAPYIGNPTSHTQHTVPSARKCTDTRNNSHQHLTTHNFLPKPGRNRAGSKINILFLR